MYDMHPLYQLSSTLEDSGADDVFVVNAEYILLLSHMSLKFIH